MFIVLSSIVLVLCATASTGDNCDPTKCENYAINSHYYDLDCEPVYSKSDSCCPTHYKCPQLERMSSSPEKCFYKNKEYSTREKIADKDLRGTCSAACICATGHQTENFNCANIECPTLFRPRPQNCRGIYTLDHCCAVREVCDEARSDLKTCTMEGKTYSEGEKIYPESDTCKVCVCGADGNTECRKINCGVMLHNANRLKKYCAPVYYGKNRCCPITFICHDDKHTVKPNLEPAPIDDKCKYGPLTLNVGDEIVTGEKCTKCSCISPPLATCIQDPKC